LIFSAIITALPSARGLSKGKYGDNLERRTFCLNTSTLQGSLIVRA
jgi:hypothetical protein